MCMKDNKTELSIENLTLNLFMPGRLWTLVMVCDNLETNSLETFQLTNLL